MKFHQYLLLILITVNMHAQDVIPKRIKPERSVRLDERIPEGSGIAMWNGYLWTHNDSGDAKLFALDPETAQIKFEFILPGVRNNDWEELAQDEDHFFIGDFGNNLGLRDTVQIIRVNKAAMSDNNFVIGVIAFDWPVDEHGAKKNYNCEAMVASGDNLYIFTKERQSGRQTSLFSIPKIPGHHKPKFISKIKTGVLITGASYDATSKRLVLCGYNLWLRPFLLTFDDATFPNVFNSNAKKSKIRKCFRQTEGIATSDGINYFLINEDFRLLFIHKEQEIHQLTLPGK